MFGSLYRIFLRYRDETLRLEQTGLPLVFPKDARDAGHTLLRVDRIVLQRNRLVVEGWCRAARIGLRLNRTLLWTTPDLARPGEDLRGFTLDIPFETGQPALLVAGQEHAPLALPAFSRLALWWAGMRRWGPYLGSILKVVPQIWRWKLRGDLGAREVIKEELRLVPRSEAVEMSGRCFSRPPGPLRPCPLPPPPWWCRSSTPSTFWTRC